MQSRRNFLMVGAGTMAATGGGLALWALLRATGSSDGDPFVRFEIASLPLDRFVTLDCARLPIIVRRRSAEEIAALEHPPSTRIPRKVSVYSSDKASEPVAWHRSLRADVVVLVANCTRDGCIVRDDDQAVAPSGGFVCPCCWSRYDLAGRVLSGPPPNALAVPFYEIAKDDAIIVRGVRDRVCADRSSS